MLTIKKQTEILSILTAIRGTSYSDVQSPDKLLEYAFQLTQWIAFTAEAIAEAKEQLHLARKQAYINLVGSLGAQEKKIGAMLMKDYCNDMCSKENAYLTLCERTNAAATHTNDLVRSALSYLKTEMATQNYSN
jgi:hypothetical protein